MADAGSRRRPKLALYQTILLAMVAGLVLGPILGKNAASLGELGKLLITLIKAVATPLLFFAIINAIAKTEVSLRSGLRMIAIATFNASIALTIGLLVSNLLQPGKHMARALANTNAGAAATYAEKKVDFLQTIIGYVPTSVVTPFAENAIIPVILIALFVGFGLRRARREQIARSSASYRAIEDGVETMLHVTEIVLGWIVKLIPFAVFGVVAKTVGEYGYAPLRGLAWYLGAGLFGLLLHAGITYQLWIALATKIPLRVFWQEAREPAIYGMGANSSLATLPVTLRALDRLGVSKSSSALGACVGTNLNNDGIILYEGMAVLFVAQASGIDLTLSQQLLAASICLVAAMGVAGVPESGIISLALVLNTVGLPIELLPLLLTVDWILARARSVGNVLSDMVLSILIDRFSVGSGRGTDDRYGGTSVQPPTDPVR